MNKVRVWYCDREEFIYINKEELEEVKVINDPCIIYDKLRTNDKDNMYFHQKDEDGKWKLCKTIPL